MAYTLSQFKEVLDGLGYHLGPDGLNGNHGNFLDVFTQAAIRELQTHYHLPVTGKLDAATDNFVQTLIRNIQFSLNLVVSVQLPVNEFYGPRTVQAMKTFQRAYGLPMTGIANVSVLQKLDEETQKQALAQPYPQKVATL
jgi:peptidoglycan hydrolase-like protein with peptidoglycan-binding domain